MLQTVDLAEILHDDIQARNAGTPKKESSPSLQHLKGRSYQTMVQWLKPIWCDILLLYFGCE